MDKPVDSFEGGGMFILSNMLLWCFLIDLAVHENFVFHIFVASLSRYTGSFLSKSFSCSSLRQRHALQYGRGRSRCAVKLYVHLWLRLSGRSALLPSHRQQPHNEGKPSNDVSVLLNANMPTLRHSYTLTLADNLPQHKADVQRKNPPHKLVSSLMGLIINPVKVSCQRLLMLLLQLLLLQPHFYEHFYSGAPLSGWLVPFFFHKVLKFSILDT